MNVADYKEQNKGRGATGDYVVDSLTITVITDNYYDKLRPDQKIARRAKIAHGTSMHSEHGLSYHIEASASGRTHAFMFDYGVEGEGIVKNMKLLEIDPGRLEAFALSHGHYDHWGSLIHILKGHKVQIKQGIPLYVGEEAFARRFSRPPAKADQPGDVEKDAEDLGQLAREEIERLGVVEIVEITSPTEVVPGAFLTGNIERVTAYEKGFARLLIKRGNTLEPDSFQGEQALVFNVKEKGLVVVSSCAHAGIINTIRHAQKIMGVERVHAVLGGFHLTGAEPALIAQTVADMKRIHPDYIVPMHCTGFEAITAFAGEMPEQFILNTAGTRYVFGAEEYKEAADR
jgi:7,8-dihydropterin-6-yl-methyl-4-(beta-D-ribofuranosyl)aminobenzene 5'-phosphate synthase